MSEKPFIRKARLSDFFEIGETPDTNTNNQDRQNNDANTIAKNQQEFGNRKRIKP